MLTDEIILLLWFGLYSWEKFGPNSRASLIAVLVKNPPAMQETWVRSVGWEDPLEKGKATHSSVLAWRIPGMGEPGGLPSLGSHRGGHDWSDLAAAAAAVQEKVRLAVINSFDSLMMNLKKAQWIVLDILKDMCRPGVLGESWSESSFQRNWWFLGLERMLSTSVNWDLFGILKRKKAGKVYLSLWSVNKQEEKDENWVNRVT